jgi:hypothetical protein
MEGLTMHTPRPPVLRVIPVASAVLVILLGLITFGVQATVEPRGVPLAVAAPAPLQQAAQRIASQGGEQVSWRVATPEEGRRLLDEKAVYGVLELAPTKPPAVVLSGAVNPTGTQIAQQVLSAAAQAAQAATPAAATSGQPPSPVAVQTVHPASAAARTLPLAASTLLWLGCLAGNVLLVVIMGRARRPTTVPLRLATAAGVTLGATAALLGLIALWDAGLFSSGQVDAPLIGFLLLIAFAYATVQGTILRLIGLPGIAVLAPLYLMAPAVAGQVPEVLHPAYRVLLWSWSPIRFSTEGVRSILMLDTVPPDVRTALWVLTGITVAGLVGLLWPGRRGPVPPPDADEGAASKPVPTVAPAA